MSTNVTPQVVYGTTGDIALRIGNGGAGQAGLVEALALAYIKAKIASGKKPFRVAWYKSDTTITLGYLADGTIDVGLSYNEAAEAIALTEGYAAGYAYAFRDHFCIAGPTENPAGLEPSDGALTAFQKIYTAGEASKARFLSRFDKSATNIKESSLWAAIGQIPWAIPYSTWYQVYLDFPIQALGAAAALGQYTLTDRGTWLFSKPPASFKIFVEGSDDASDPLLNPCHALASTKTSSQAVATEFIAWLVSAEGQGVIAGFKKNGQVLYSPAPTTSVHGSEPRR